MDVSNKELIQKETCAGILILKSNGVLEHVNSKYLQMTGFEKEELLGKEFNLFFDENALSNRRKTSFGHYHSLLKQKSGNRIPVEIFLLFFGLEQDKILIIIKETDSFHKFKLTSPIFEKVFNDAHEAIFVTDANGCIQSANKVFSKITGYDEDEVLGKSPSFLNSGRQDTEFYENFWSALLNKGCWQGEIWNKRKNGEVYPEWLNVSSIKDNLGNITNYVSHFIDITNRKKSEEELHFNLYHDSLTSLPNRTLLFEKLEHLCQLNNDTPVFFALLFCDVDRFKSINDAFGHEVGDNLLREIANRLKLKLRDNDIVARSGGDEFIVVIEGKKAINNMDKVCNHVLSVFDRPFKTMYGDFQMTLSIGISQFPLNSKDIRELVSFANVAMHKVKEKGGNYYSFFDLKDKKQTLQKLELDAAIEQGIKNKEFELYYQPQVNTQTKKVYGLECLLRWHHPTYGLVSPDVFIPIAEENGTIKQLGYFVLQSACQQLKTWQGLNIFNGVMAINVSLRQFERNDFVIQYENTLQQENISNESIEIEVTESLFSENSSYYLPILHQIRTQGTKVAIDDFGTGYSSLQRLKDLPIDNVKIDKCFIDNIESCEKDKAIVNAIILLSQTFGINLIAEGIETQKQSEILSGLGCVNQQGYYFSRPLNANNLKQWLSEYTEKNL